MRGDRRSPHFWVSVIRQFRLAWRLLWDRRVPLWPKLLPLATLAYILSPIDVIPDVIVGLGQLDDLALLLLATQVFTMICPRAVVDAIRQEMDGQVIDGEWRRTDADRPASSPRLPKSDR
jgi:uncharacterized membrane protein YkvA (DUF1232 family)